MGLLPLPRWVRRNHQAVPQQKQEAQVDSHVRLVNAPNDLTLGPADERVPVSLLDPARTGRLVQGQWPQIAMTKQRSFCVRGRPHQQASYVLPVENSPPCQCLTNLGHMEEAWMVNIGLLGLRWHPSNTAHHLINTAFLNQTRQSGLAIKGRQISTPVERLRVSWSHGHKAIRTPQWAPNTSQ